MLLLKDQSFSLKLTKIMVVPYFFDDVTNYYVSNLWRLLIERGT